MIIKKANIIFLLSCVVISIITFIIVSFFKSDIIIYCFSIFSGFSLIFLYLEKRQEPRLQRISRLYSEFAKPTTGKINQSGLKEVKRIRKSSPDKEIKEIICRSKFREILGLWDQPDAIATFHAISSVAMLTSFKGLDKTCIIPIHEQFLNDELIDNMVIKRCFQVYENDSGCWYANERNKKASLEAAYAALKTAYLFLDRSNLDCSISNLESILGEGRISKFKRYLLSCFDHQSGGFRDKEEKSPSISTTGIAIRISKIILNYSSDTDLEKKMSDYFKFETNNTPATFISKCYKGLQVNNEYVEGFADYPKSRNLWICVTYFAVASLRLLGNREILNIHKEEITGLTEKCLVERDKTIGFKASTAYEREDLMHTYYALKLLDIVNPHYLKARDDSFFIKIAAFVDTCKSGLGYGFRENMAPNVFTTCLARNIYKFIEDYNSKIKYNFDPFESVMFYASCYDRKSKSAFTGYPF